MSAASMSPMGAFMGGGGASSTAAAAHSNAVLEAHVTQSKTMDCGKAFTALQKTLEQSEHDWALKNVEVSTTELLKKVYRL